MNDHVHFYPHNGYSAKLSNRFGSSPGGLPPDEPAKVNYENSWIKNHIKNNNTLKTPKKLTTFLDTILSYDVKNGPGNESDTADKSLLFKTPDYNSGGYKFTAEPQSGLDSHSREMGRKVAREYPASRETTSVQQDVDNRSSEILFEQSEPKNGLDKHPREMGQTASRVKPVSQGTTVVQNETNKKSTDLKFEEYITETWEKYRKQYEHLGEKNPFANDPPSPEFLRNRYRVSTERGQSSSNEEGENYESVQNYKNVTVSTGDDNHERIVPSQGVDQMLGIDAESKGFNESISDENEAIVSFEPEVEELEFQSESNSESDHIINNNESFSPTEDETQVADSDHGVQILDSKHYAARYIEDHVVEQSNEYDEINSHKSKETSLKSVVPDVRSLSTNDENYSTNKPVNPFTDTKVNELKSQKPGRGTKTFRKLPRKPQKQYVLKNSSHQPLRPLVNPYLVSPLGSAAMMPPPNPLYPFQTPGASFNYWMAKPPFNQYNMFPYGYPWQGLHFTPPYFQPLFQHNMTPTPFIGSSLVGQHNFIPTAPIGQHNFSPTAPVGPSVPSPLGGLSLPSTEVSAGTGYGKSNVSSTTEIPTNETEVLKGNYNQGRTATRPYQSNFQKSEFNYSHPGHQVQQHPNFRQMYKVNKMPNRPFRHDQKLTQQHELDNSVNSHHFGRQSTYMIVPPDVRQNLSPNSYNPRLNTSALSSSELRSQTSPPPTASSHHWHREQSTLGTNMPRFQGSPPPVPPPVPQPQQRMNYQIHHYGTPTNEYERTSARLNTEYPTNHLGEQQSLPPSPYHSWFNFPSQYGHGNFPSHNYSAEGSRTQL